jgi:predicted kinase
MTLNTEVTQPIAIIPIGPSGSGKSTLYTKLVKDIPDLKSFSWDTLRLEWYDPKDYSKAWALANKDKQFYNRALDLFMEMLRKKENIYVDNINITPRSRSQFVRAAKQYGYKVVAQVFNVTEKTLMERAKTRKDKSVPHDALRRQIESLQIPVQGDGEFDEVKLVE